MNKRDILKDCKIEFAIYNLIEQIKQEVNEYKNTRDENSKQKLAMYIQDREKIYNNDEETTSKYFNMRRLG